MTERPLHLAAYDIADPRRLRRALRVLKGYSTGGQKSVFECYLSTQEKRDLLEEVAAIADPDEDKFVLLRLDPRSAVHCLGIAVEPCDPDYFYVG